MAEEVGQIYYSVTADTAKLVGQTRVVERETGKMAGAFNKITQAIQLYAAALAIVKSAQMADDMRLLAARVRVAAGSLEDAGVAMQRLQSISARTQTALAANVQVFTRLNASLRQMGGTQDDTLRVTELLGMAIKVSGASAAEASSAMTQFGQALGSGKLSGDELRSLLENAPYLMQQLATGLGVGIGALKGLGEEGKLTADVVVDALGKAAGTIKKDFDKLPQTFGGAMTALLDGAARANEAMDTLTGTSAATTGIVQGAASAFDMLADRLLGVTTEGDRLAQNDKVKSWATATTEVLSYVADAADFVTRAFRQAGIGLGGMAAAAAAVVRGEFAGARDVMTQVGRDIMAISDPKYAGAAMRQRLAAMASGTDGSDPLDRRAAGGTAPSKLKTPAGTKGGKAGKQRDDGYLEALKAEKQIMLEAEEARKRFYDKQQADAEKAAADRAAGLALATDASAAGDPVMQLELELKAKSDKLAEYAALDMENAQIYAEAQVALERDTQAKIADIIARRQSDQLAAQAAMLGNYGSLFGSLAEVTKQFEGEQSGAYRAMFAVSKAFAIADSIVKIQQGIAASLSLPYPANIAAAASTAAAAAGIVGTIQGANFGGGRQYGGSAVGGSLYRVNETGQPEMFTASNGAQYMMPTRDGRVTAADKVGGGGVSIQVINNHPTARVDATSDDRGQIVQIAISEVAQQINGHQGPVWQALRGSTNVTPRL